MKLLVGLGNPGSQYEGTRHNIGFMAVDAIARRHNFSPWRRRFQGEFAEGTIGGDKVLALKPLTYMNLSGQSVGEALRFYKLEPTDMIVFHDELDLLPGRIRVKAGGGHGGHNGLRSIDQHVGPHYLRVRLGIGHPGDKNQVSSYVLHPFAKSDRTWLDLLLDAVADHVGLLAVDKDAEFMNRVTLAVSPPKPKKPTEPTPPAAG